MVQRPGWKHFGHHAVLSAQDAPPRTLLTGCVPFRLPLITGLTSKALTINLNDMKSVRRQPRPEPFSDLEIDTI